MYGHGMADYNGGMYGGAMYNPYAMQQQQQQQQQGMQYAPPHTNGGGIDYHIPLPASAQQAAAVKKEGGESAVENAPGTGKKKKKKTKAQKAAAAAAAASAAPAATSVSAPPTPSASATSVSTAPTTVAPVSVTSVPNVSSASAVMHTAPSAASSSSHSNIPLIAPSSYASKSEQHRPMPVFNHVAAPSIVTAAAFPPISSPHTASTSLHGPSTHTATAFSAPASPAAATQPSSATASAVSSAAGGVKAPALLNYASKVGSMSAAEVAKVAAAAKAAREAKLKGDAHQSHTAQDKGADDSGEVPSSSASNKENTHVENAPPTPQRPSSASAHREGREGVWVKKDTSGSATASASASGGSGGASTSPSWRERSREYPKRIHAPHPQRFGGYGGRQFGNSGPVAGLFYLRLLRRVLLFLAFVPFLIFLQPVCLHSDARSQAAVLVRRADQAHCVRLRLAVSRRRRRCHQAQCHGGAGVAYPRHPASASHRVCACRSRCQHRRARVARRLVRLCLIVACADCLLFLSIIAGVIVRPVLVAVCLFVCLFVCFVWQLFV